MGGLDVIQYLRLICETCSAFRNALMFNNELMADVHFIVGPLGGSQKVPAHKVKTFLHFLFFFYENIETMVKARVKLDASKLSYMFK